MGTPAAARLPNRMRVWTRPARSRHTTRASPTSRGTNVSGCLSGSCAVTVVPLLPPQDVPANPLSVARLFRTLDSIEILLSTSARLTDIRVSSQRRLEYDPEYHQCRRDQTQRDADGAEPLRPFAHWSYL